MPSFSTTSKDRLKTCHQDLQTLFHYVIEFFDCTIVCGYRDKDAQNKAYMDGKSQVRWANSKHNKTPSMAVDVAPFNNGVIDWDYEQMYYFAGFVLGVAKMLKKYGAITSDIRLGADWDGDNEIHDQRFKDLPHFEIL